MAAGHYIAKLRQTRAGMDRHQVERSIDAWTAGASTLATLGTELGGSAKDVGDSFGPHSEVGRQARLVIESVQRGVVTDSGNMHKASGVLGDVRDTMHATEQEAGTMPAAAPGAPPRMEGGPYDDDAAEIRAMKVHAAKVAVYNQQVSAYDDADNRARVQVERVNAEYDRAAEFFYGLYDHPEQRDPSGTTSAGTGGTGGTGPLGTRPAYSDPKHHPAPTTPAAQTVPADTTTPTHGHPTGPGDTRGPGDHPTDLGQVGPGSTDDPAGPSVPSNPFGSDEPAGAGAPGSSGSPVAPAAGTTGLGVLGGLGLRNLLSSAPTPISVPGEPTTATIGSTARTGSGSVLGRSASGTAGSTGRGSLAPGQSVGRGAGRGVGSASGTGRRRRKEGDEAGEKEIYDVERDWTDDEGQFPGVIS